MLTLTQGAETLGVESFGGTTPLDGGEGLAKSRGFAPGTVINGRYTVLQTLGRGGMGHVYDVTDAVNPERAVALKVISALGASPAKVSLFKAEFRTMTKLEHPNVARVYDLESVQGNNDFLITMERIDGEPLRDAVEPGDVKSTVDALVGVCRALSYVHSRRIVHFDLKPDNVLVCKDGAVKVVDFGIAGGEPSRHEGHLLGTPLYMAPQMLLGNQQADHRADLYALGIAFYEVLTGRPPLRLVDVMSISSWLMNGGLKCLADPLVPKWLAPILERLSALDPSDRYRSANAVIEAINAAGPVRYELETEDTKQSYLLSSRFSGRDAELQRAVSFMNERLSGEAREPLLIVSGVSGIGKSRLMREVRYQAQLQRTPFLEANCHERSLVEYGPIAELLVQLVPMVEALGGVAEVADALPQLVKIAPVLGKGRTVPNAQRADSAEAERVQLLETTSEFFVRAAARLGFVLYVNDLQWADRGPVALLSHLAQRIRDEEEQARSVRIGIVLSHRSDEVQGRPLEQLLQLTERQPIAQKIQLEHLSAKHVSDVIRSMLGIESVPPEFVERVAEETKGNPYFVQEVMRVLLENDTVFLDGDRWATKETIGEMRIPSSMTDVFRRRFSLLDEPEKDVARILSVHARPMRLELLAQVLGSGQTAEALRELEERRIVERVSGNAPTYALAHDRMRETIYGDLPEEDRRSWHQQIAESLEALSAELAEKDQPLDELALHYRHAGNTAKATSFSAKAGHRALENYANDAAVAHFEYVVTNQSGASFQARALLAEALLRKGEATRSAAILSEVLGRCESAIDRARMRSLLSKCLFSRGAFRECAEEAWHALDELGIRQPRGSTSLALALLRDVIWLKRQKDIVVDSAPIDARMQLIAALYGWILLGFVYQGTEQRWWVAHTMIRAAKFGGLAGACKERSLSRALLGAVLAFTGAPEEAKRWLEAATREAEANQHIETEVSVAVGRSHLLSCQIVHEDQIAMLEGALTRARVAGTSFYTSIVVLLFDAYIRAGAWQRATGTYVSTRQYVERSARMLAYDGGLYATIPLLMLHATGKHEEAVALARQVRQLVTERNQGNAEQILNDHAAEPLLASGDVAGAIAVLEASWRTAEKEGVFLFTDNVFRLLPRTYLFENPGDATAQRRAERIIKKGRALIEKGFQDKKSLVEMSEAILRDVQGRKKEADQCFALALESAQYASTTFFRSEILLQRGLAYQRRGDRLAARSDIEAARAIALETADVYMQGLCDRALR